MSRVLVIDDESIVGVILRLALDAKGHETVVAEDGQTGIEMARAERPDAIVLDLMMPFMDGFAVLETLREDERTAEIPVMVLTAVQSEDVEQRCYGLGAKTFFRKPFDGDHFVGAVEDLLAGDHPPIGAATT